MFIFLLSCSGVWNEHYNLVMLLVSVLVQNQEARITVNLFF